MLINFQFIFFKLIINKFYIFVMQPRVPSILRKQALKMRNSKLVSFSHSPININSASSASAILESTNQDITPSTSKNIYNQSKIVQNIHHNTDQEHLPKAKKIILKRKENKNKLSLEEESFTNQTMKKQPIFYPPSPQKQSIFKKLQFSMKEQIEPIFRYCFLCQRSILEINMDAHQQVCENFQKLINNSEEQIMKILLDKIKRIKLEIIETTKNYNIQKFFKLEKSVESIIKNCEKIQQIGYINQQFEKSYKVIQEIYTSPQVKLLELSYKLRWFLKIREQMKHRYSI